MERAIDNQASADKAISRTNADAPLVARLKSNGLSLGICSSVPDE